MSLDIKCFPRGMYGENTYLVTDRATGLQAVIDPGYYGSDVAAEIQGESLRYLLLTHGHHDHFYAAGQYLDKYDNAVFAAPGKDTGIMKSDPYPCPEPSMLLSEGDDIVLGETVFTVIETPGHTGGGVCFRTDDCIFTGDTLFRLSVGRTDLPTGDWSALQDSISRKLYALDEDLTVYPGHGSETSIGFEKKANPFV